MYRDMFELLARPDIDAVLIATGDRWHAPASILAAKAGKDVYSEKPCGITIALCQALDDTIRRPGACSRRARSGGASRTSRPPCSWPKAASWASSRRCTPRSTTPRSLRLAAGRARAAQGRGRLGPLAGAGPVASLQPSPTSTAGGAAITTSIPAAGCSTGARTRSISASGPTGPTKPCRWSTRPTGGTINARYANGVKLVHASPDGWLGLGTCPVRFEGDEGWVETGDSGSDRGLSGVAPQRVARARARPAASPPHSTCGTSSTASSRGACRRPTPA